MASEAATETVRTEPLAVELAGIEKRFPGVIANKDVWLKVGRATIHAIVGENGAGKSTLMKTLYGMHQPDAGTITVNGATGQFQVPVRRHRGGHRHGPPTLHAGGQPDRAGERHPRCRTRRRGRIDTTAALQKFNECARLIGSHIDGLRLVAELGVGDRQRVEIIKVLYRGARILILDEPTAVLVPQEVDELFDSLKLLVADGATIIFISHKLDEVLAVADDITVIRAGTTVGSVKPAEVNRKQLSEMMVGFQLPTALPRATAISDEVRLELDSVTVAGIGAKPLVDAVSFRVRGGEIVGIAGVEGSGQFELCEAIMGIRQLASGTVRLGGRDITELSARETRGEGIGYIPFDRHREGLMLSAPLWENALLGRETERQFRNGPFVDVAAVRADTRDIITTFGVRTPNETVPAFALSGGNQQKLIVGRELESEPQGADRGAPDPRGRRRCAGHHLGRIAGRPRCRRRHPADLGRPGRDPGAVRRDPGDVRQSRSPPRLIPAEATPELLGTYMTGGEQEVA